MKTPSGEGCFTYKTTMSTVNEVANILKNRTHHLFEDGVCLKIDGVMKWQCKKCTCATAINVNGRYAHINTKKHKMALATERWRLSTIVDEFNQRNL
mgnify:CR=1 FL=1